MLEEVKAVPIQTLGRRESSASGAEDTAVGQVASPEWQSFRSVSFVELRYTVPSHVDIMSPFVDQLMRFISRYRGPDESNFEIELALREALAKMARCVHIGGRDSAKEGHLQRNHQGIDSAIGVQVSSLLGPQRLRPRNESLIAAPVSRLRLREWRTIHGSS